MITQIILAVIAAFTTGGWFVNYRQKKIVEAANADNATLSVSKNAVDVANEIAKSYNETILKSMCSHDDRHDNIDEKLDYIMSELQVMSKFLNGAFAEFKQKQERDQKGYFKKI